MEITLGPDLEAALSDLAHQQGIDPEALALGALRERFLGDTVRPQAQDEWERSLLDAARNCGLSLPNSALSSEGLYE